MSRRSRSRQSRTVATRRSEGRGRDQWPGIDRAEVRKPVVEADDVNPYGGATETDLAKVVATEFGSDPELEASDTIIAVEGLARVIAARMGHVDWPRDPRRLAIFIMTDRARDLARTLTAAQEPILDNGSRRLTGKLWIAGPSFASGYYVTLAGKVPGDLFAEVTAKGIGDVPALVFDPAATDPEIRYYRHGVNGADDVKRFLVAERTFTLGGLDKVLDRFYGENIITPDAAVHSFNPWENGNKYIPRRKVESFLQGWLKSILSIAFHRHVIRFEQPGSEGRCDLLIFSRAVGKAHSFLCHAVLELKVLRSFDAGANQVSATVRRNAIKDGLLQTIAYKRQQAAKDGMLCCFDMRTPSHCDGNTCFDEIRAQAKRHAIALRRYRLYGRSADLRADKYGGESASS